MKLITSLAAAFLLAFTALNPAHADPWKGFYAGAGPASWIGEEQGYSVTVGYNQRYKSRWVVGGEYSYFSDFDAKFSSNFITSRGGYLIKPNMLIYALFGVGNFSEGDQGLRLGGGVEWAQSDRLSFRLEAAKEQCCGNPIFEGGDVVRAYAVWHF